MTFNLERFFTAAIVCVLIIFTIMLIIIFGSIILTQLGDFGLFIYTICITVTATISILYAKEED